MSEKVLQSRRAQQVGRRPFPQQSEVDSCPIRYPQPPATSSSQTAVQTGAPIGWARVSASVLIFQPEAK